MRRLSIDVLGAVAVFACMTVAVVPAKAATTSTQQAGETDADEPTQAELDEMARKIGAHAGGSPDAEGDGHADPGETTGSVVVVTDPIEYPYHFQRYGDFIAGGGCPPGTVLVDIILVTVNGPAPGDREELLVEQVCYEWARIAGSTEPPTVTPGFAGEIVEAYLPVPRFQMNPADYAVTGIETWVWYGDDGRLDLEAIDHDGDPTTPARWGATVTATDAGGINTVTARAWISEYRWEMGDGEVIRSSVPGSEDEPAGEHLYTSTAPENRVRASVIWRGDYTSMNVATTTSGTLPPIAIEGSWEDYPIYQIRSVPVSPRGSNI